MNKISYLAIVTVFILVGCERAPSERAPSREEINSTYLGKLSVVKKLMLEKGNVAKGICDNHVKAWHDAIYVSREDISEAVGRSVADQRLAILGLTGVKRNVEILLLDLNPPPDGFANTHSILISMYESFEKLVDAAESPSGSYSTYSANVKSSQSQFDRKMEDLRMLVP